MMPRQHIAWLDRPDTAEVAADDARLVVALRNGDERAFHYVLNRYHASMVRLAVAYVGDRAVAEDVAQEAWLGVLRGLDRFEGRSSFKTWIFRILVNRAKTWGQREGRTISFSQLQRTDAEMDEPAVDPARFLDAGDSGMAGHWRTPPHPWNLTPEQEVLSDELRCYILDAIETLPMTQREVIRLRDIEGWTADEVCAVLEISDGNERVLLHRARSKVRRALEQYFGEK